MKKVLLFVALAAIFCTAAVWMGCCDDIFSGTMIYEEYDNGLCVEYMKSGNTICNLVLDERFFKNAAAEVSIHTSSGTIQISSQPSMMEYLIEKGFSNAEDNKQFCFEDGDVLMIESCHSDKIMEVKINLKKPLTAIPIYICSNWEMIRCPNSPDEIKKIFGKPSLVSSHHFI